MKTTLKYNTIETLQRQPAWKKFIDTLVDECNTLYDGNLAAEVEDGTTKDGDAGTLEISTLKLSESVQDLQARYALLDYSDDKIMLTSRENISLKGLLRVLSLYNCKIKDVETDTIGLPHTYRAEFKNEGIDNIPFGSSNIPTEACASYNSADNVEGEGYYIDEPSQGGIPFGYHYGTGTDEDDETRGIKPDVVDPDTSYTPDYDSGNVEAEGIDVDAEVDEYKYKHNIYGYNQKPPVLSLMRTKEVLIYYEFTRKDLLYTQEEIAELPQSEQDFLHSLTRVPSYLYMKETDIMYNSKTDYQIYGEDVYKLTNNLWSGISAVSSSDLNVKMDGSGRIVDAGSDAPMSLADILSTCYFITKTKSESDDTPNKAQKWVKTESAGAVNEYGFVVTDISSEDLKRGWAQLVIYNQVSANSQYILYFALTNDSPIEKLVFTRLNMIGLNIEQQVEESLRYYVYEDSFYHRWWVIMNNIEQYNYTPIRYLKNQIFAEECCLKAQPLFKYEGTVNTSDFITLCANFINAQGGENKITFEMIGNYTGNVGLNQIMNNTGGKRVVYDISYGEYMYKWEQYNLDDGNKGMFVKDVYAAQNFENPDSDNSDLNFFYDCYRWRKYISPQSSDYRNNEVKVIGNYIYENTFEQEFIETMFFNHFIKVYPIMEDESEEGIVTTTKLYCDNLELVEYGNVTPYIVSYDRKGVEEDGKLIDLDTSIFSKILSYNKRTHLITVDYPVYFENASTPKYVVVAYQNASPFNKTKMLNITAPDEDIKNIVGNILEDYKNFNYELNLFTETEYDEYKKDLDFEKEVEANNNIIDERIDNLLLKYEESNMLYGSYDLSADTGGDILLTVTESAPYHQITYVVRAFKEYGFFYFQTHYDENTSRYIVDNVLDEYQQYTPLLVENITKIEFSSGGDIVTSLYFNNMLNNLNLGDGIFVGLSSLQVICNFKPKTHTTALNDRVMWLVKDFEGLTELMYINPETFMGTTELMQNMLDCPMFKNTKIGKMDFSNINWTTPNVAINFNFNSMFEGCEYLEDVNFKLSGNKKFKAISMTNTFKGCRGLKEIDLSDIDLSDFDLSTEEGKQEFVQNAFSGCTRLKHIKTQYGVIEVQQPI